MTANTDNRLDRRAAVARILEDRGETLVVGGLGSSSFDVTAPGDSPLNFPMWGAMGSAATIGLGLAIAQPDRRVLVVTGDGEMLMGIGSLLTIAMQAPENLSIIVIDNEHYGATGMQDTHTLQGADLAGIAAASGIAVTGTIHSEEDLEAALPAMRTGAGPSFHVIKVQANTPPKALPPRDGSYLKDRFRIALLGEKAAVI
ncbi:MAG: aldehyde dehydrogenase [Rhodobacteraceae bacterium]|nr:aldehyde dehydrogenase [Paracoccaceae bacterium]